jgi:hypothetical protein
MEEKRKSRNREYREERKLNNGDREREWVSDEE